MSFKSIQKYAILPFEIYAANYNLLINSTVEKIYLSLPLPWNIIILLLDIVNINKLIATVASGHCLYCAMAFQGLWTYWIDIQSPNGWKYSLAGSCLTLTSAIPWNKNLIKPTTNNIKKNPILVNAHFTENRNYNVNIVHLEIKDINFKTFWVGNYHQFNKN